jgi:hypothetical protein
MNQVHKRTAEKWEAMEEEIVDQIMQNQRNPNPNLYGRRIFVWQNYEDLWSYLVHLSYGGATHIKQNLKASFMIKSVRFPCW